MCQICSMRNDKLYCTDVLPEIVPPVDFADIPGDISTPATVAVGGTYTDVLEVVGDQDWIRVNLVAGQQYTISLNGSGASALSDPYLELRNASGAIVAQDDDSGPGLFSLLTYTATTTGSFFINARAFNNAFAGTYTVAVSAGVAPPPPPTSLPTLTFAEIANQLTDGFWQATGRTRHAFNTQTITYNIENLTAEGQALAIAAFEQWSGVTGRNFQRITTAAQISFDDNQAGAFASYTASGNVTSTSFVNVSTAWLATYGTGINSYSFQTYLHEIGHALGLGHAGNYNGSAGYSATGGGDNFYLNDSWQATLMSYFDQDQNSTVNATRAFTVTPMMADIIAIQNLYGTPINIRTGATTYGFNSTAGSVYNFASYAAGDIPAYTIFDSSGVDTLDASGFSMAQLLDLRPGQFSNIGGETGNIGIATNTVIENAIGGTGGDIILGNGINNLLRGLAGSDTMDGGLGLDTSSYALSRASYTLSRQSDGAVRVVGGPDGGDTLYNVELLGFTDVTMSSLPNYDFSGDFSSDLLLRNNITGGVSLWNIANGAFSASIALGGVGSNIGIVGSGDFNHDGSSDILLRDFTTGSVSNWQIRGGAFVASATLGTMGSNIAIAGIGDFNIDGNSDLLLRDGITGGVSIWSVNFANVMTGSFTIGGLGSNVAIAGVGDFFGDGGSDVLLRDFSTGAVTVWRVSNNGFVGSTTIGGVGANYDVVGAYDFSGDALADVLLRDRSTGAVSYWRTDASGAVVQSVTIGGIGSNFSILGARDVNGDGYNDVLLRDANTGTISAFGVYAGQYSQYYTLGGAGSEIAFI